MSLNPKMTDWHDKVVWLIGASSGIGRACAQALYQRGARIVISARSESALKQFTQAHPASLALALDVSQAATLASATEKIHSHYGRIDMVVYCAGHYSPQSASAFNQAEMQRHLTINYIGALHTLAAILPLMQAQSAGHISLVASVAGYRGLPLALAYGPTKAALINLAEILYLDLQASGIAVSVVNPGFVKTPLTAQNTFTMPALLTPEQAADYMIQGWERGQFDIHFPKRFSLLLKLLQCLPYRWYFPLIRKATA